MFSFVLLCLLFLSTGDYLVEVSFRRTFLFRFFLASSVTDYLRSFWHLRCSQQKARLFLLYVRLPCDPGELPIPPVHFPANFFFEEWCHMKSTTARHFLISLSSSVLTMSLDCFFTMLLFESTCSVSAFSF